MYMMINNIHILTDVTIAMCKPKKIFTQKPQLK
jgi:hypothetical protein